MIVIDTNIWIDHLRSSNTTLCALLEVEDARMHPYVLGEIALGSLHGREEVLSRLAALPEVPVADHATVLAIIERQQLSSTGIGYVDAHLIASTLIVSDGLLWTQDKRLHAQATRLAVTYTPRD